MRFKQFLTELDKRAEKKQRQQDKRKWEKEALSNLHKQQQDAKKREFDSKYNNGEPVKVALKVYVKKPSWTGETPYETREFTIDNYTEIRHKLADVVLIDLATADDDPTKHDDKASYAIMKTRSHMMGSIPQYLHDLPPRTRKKPGYAPEDLRREAYADDEWRQGRQRAIADIKAKIQSHGITRDQLGLDEAISFAEIEKGNIFKSEDGCKIKITDASDVSSIKFEENGRSGSLPMPRLISWMNNKNFMMLPVSESVMNTIYDYFKKNDARFKPLRPQDIKAGDKFKVEAYGGTWIYEIVDASDNMNVLYTMKPDWSTGEGVPAWDDPVDFNDLYDGDDEEIQMHLKKSAKAKPRGIPASQLTALLNDREARRVYG